jgi:DNA-binding transcriptional LysR family regulator
VRDPHSGFEEKELIEEPIALLVRPGHPLAHRKRLQWSHLANYPWVLPPVGSLLRDPLERALEQHGVPLASNYIETLSTHLARAYLLLTDAIGVMAGGVANDAAQPLAILPLALGKLMRPRGVLWNKERGLSPGAMLMIECLEEAAEHHMKTGQFAQAG